jgi:hypothetical protein
MERSEVRSAFPGTHPNGGTRQTRQTPDVQKATLRNVEEERRFGAIAENLPAGLSAEKAVVLLSAAYAKWSVKSQSRIDHGIDRKSRAR